MADGSKYTGDFVNEKRNGFGISECMTELRRIVGSGLMIRCMGRDR